MNKVSVIVSIFIVLLFAAEPIDDSDGGSNEGVSNGRVGAPFPGNPLNDRAKGYLVAGKAKTAVSFKGLPVKPMPVSHL